MGSHPHGIRNLRQGGIMVNRVFSVKGIRCLYCYRYQNGSKRYFIKIQCNNHIYKQDLDVRSNISYSELRQTASRAIQSLRNHITKPKSILSWINEYIAIRQLKPKSAKAYRRILSHYSYNYEENAEQLAKALKRGVNACQIARTVRAFFNWLIQNGVQVINPAANIKLPRGGTRHRTLTTKEIYIFYRELEKCPTEVQLFGRLLLETGARVSSIYDIRIGDLKRDGLYLRNIKSNRDYALAVPLSDSCRKLWELCIAKHASITPDKHIFKGNFAVLCGHLRKLLNDNFNTNNTGERVVIHTLRHTAATLALQSGVPIDMVCRMLDHVNVQTTMSIYAKASQKQINQAYHKLFNSLSIKDDGFADGVISNIVDANDTSKANEASAPTELKP